MNWPKKASIVQTSGCFSFPISSAQFLLSIDHRRTYLTLIPILLRYCYYCSVTKSCFFATPGTAAYQASLSFTSFQSLLKLCPLSRWCHQIISSSVTLFSCPQSFPGSGDQSIGAWASASASVLPMNIQGWFSIGLTSVISLQSKGLSRVFSSTTVWSINSWDLSLLYGLTFTSIHEYRKSHSFDYTDLFSKVRSLLFNTMSRHCLGCKSL